MKLDWELCKKIVETADNLLYENEEFKRKYNNIDIKELKKKYGVL